MQKNKRKRMVIGVRRYSKEWKVFDKRIKELMDTNTFSKYLNKKVQMLVEDYIDCPNCVLESIFDKKTERRFYKVPERLSDFLKEISKKSNVPITTIIDRLIITPMLIEK
jgi:hypothetical protein